MEKAEKDPKSLGKRLGNLGGGHDGLLDVPVDVPSVHIDCDLELEGPLAGSRVAAQPPTSGFRMFIQLAISDHAVAAVVADKRLPVS